MGTSLGTDSYCYHKGTCYKQELAALRQVNRRGREGGKNKKHRNRCQRHMQVLVCFKKQG